jgi:hypothetical protein
MTMGCDSYNVCKIKLIITCLETKHRPRRPLGRDKEISSEARNLFKKN